MRSLLELVGTTGTLRACSGEKRFYYYEVRVLINRRIGEPAGDRPDWASTEPVT